MRGFLLNQKVPSKPSEINSLEINPSHLLVVGLEKRKSKLLLRHFFLEPCPNSPEAVSSRLAALFTEESLISKNVRIAFKGQGTVIRILTFPQMKKEDFASAIRYEVEKYVPFKPDEIVFDFQILNENIDRGGARIMKVLIAAVKKTDIYQMLKIFQNADLNVGFVGVGALAVCNFIEVISQKSQENSVGFLDMGWETTTVGVLRRGTVNFIREISFGGSDIIKPLKRKFGLEPEAILKLHQDPASLGAEHRAVLDESIQLFLTELKLSLAYYSDHVNDAEPLQSFLVTGTGTRYLTGLDFLKSELKIPVNRPDIFSQLEIYEKLDEKLIRDSEDLLPLPLGLSLRP